MSFLLNGFLLFNGILTKTAIFFFQESNFFYALTYIIAAKVGNFFIFIVKWKKLGQPNYVVLV